MTKSHEVLTGEDVQEHLRRLEDNIAYYRSCDETRTALGETFMTTEGQAASIRWIVQEAEILRRLLQPHWQGFEVGDAARQLDDPENIWYSARNKT